MNELCFLNCLEQAAGFSQKRQCPYYALQIVKVQVFNNSGWPVAVSETPRHRKQVETDSAEGIFFIKCFQACSQRTAEQC